MCHKMKKLFTSLILASTILLFGAAQNSFAAKTWDLVEDVHIDKEWKIKFNASINATSVSSNVYILQGTQKIETVTTVEKNIILVKPKQNLQHDTSYQLIVNNQVKDVKGRYIKKPVSVPFVTEEKEDEAVKAVETFQSEYAMTWELPAVNYNNFRLIGTDAKGNIVGGFETNPNSTHFGITIGAKSATVKSKYGEPVKAILKGNTNYTQNYKDSYGNTTSGTYLIDDKYVTFFYDLHENNTVRSIIWIDKAIEATKPGFYRTETSSAYRKSQEDLVVHLINQSRVAAGLNELTYTPNYNTVARNHSIDMAMNNYFSHTSLSGKSPKDRMNDGNMKFSWNGENIAYGQYSSFYAHEALMNSLGHRENILRNQFTHAISGVAFNPKGIPYYTINFYSK